MGNTPSQSSPRRASKSTWAVARFLLILAAVLTGDLLLKWYAFETVAGAPIDRAALRAFADGAIPPHDSVRLLPGVLSLQLTVNHGAVFGIAQGGRWLFVVIAIIACGIITRAFWVSRANDWVLHTALALVAGGAMGNLYDRFVFGMVRDMLLLLPETRLPFGWEWPNSSSLIYPWIFNLADVALCLGIAAIVGSMLFGRKHKGA